MAALAEHQWQCTVPLLLSIWQHWPGGELLRQPPPWASTVELTIINDKAISKTFMLLSMLYRALVYPITSPATCRHPDHIRNNINAPARRHAEVFAMQTAIYAGLRNPGRDLAILNALNEKTATELAAEMRLSPSTIRAAARRVSELQLYSLRLQGGGNDLPVCGVYAKCFRRAALGAYRHFCGTFRNLELTTWSVTDGKQSISITDLRDIDSGKASVNG